MAWQHGSVFPAPAFLRKARTRVWWLLLADYPYNFTSASRVPFFIDPSRVSRADIYTPPPASELAHRSLRSPSRERAMGLLSASIQMAGGVRTRTRGQDGAVWWFSPVVCPRCPRPHPALRRDLSTLCKALGNTCCDPRFPRWPRYTGTETTVLRSDNQCLYSDVFRPFTTVLQDNRKTASRTWVLRRYSTTPRRGVVVHGDPPCGCSEGVAGRDNSLYLAIQGCIQPDNPTYLARCTYRNSLIILFRI